MSRFEEQHGLMNKNFSHGQQVEIVNTTDKYMDGKVGTIVGKPVIGYCDFYIVDMGQAIYDDKPDTCFLMTEACLEPYKSTYTPDELQAMKHTHRLEKLITHLWRQ